MKIIKGTVLTLAMLFLLGGCFNFGDESPPVPLEEGFITYKTDDFSIGIPEKWEVIGKNEFTSEVPDVTVAVFRNNVKNETFTANVNIVSKKLQTPVNSLEYAKMVINRQSSGLIGYRELTKETTGILVSGSENETLLNRFEAKKTADDITVRYVQTYGVKGDTGYIVTGSVSLTDSETVLQTVEKIVKSFRL